METFGEWEMLTFGECCGFSGEEGGDAAGARRRRPPPQEARAAGEQGVGGGGWRRRRGAEDEGEWRMLWSGCKGEGRGVGSGLRGF